MRRALSALPLLLILLAPLAPAAAEEEIILEDDPADPAAPVNGTPAPPPPPPGEDKAALLEDLKAALAKPETAPPAVLDLGPRVNTPDAAKLIVYAASLHGEKYPELRKACLEALVKMGAPEVLEYLFNIRKDPRVNSKGYEFAYEVLGAVKIEETPRLTVNEKTLFEKRREALLQGLSTSSPSILMACAKAIGQTGDKRCVPRLIDKLQFNGGGKVGEAIGAALQGLTGQSQPDYNGWKSWYQANAGNDYSEKPPMEGGEDGPKTEAQAKAEAEYYGGTYYGIPIKSGKMSFVLDASDSMGPDENPDPSDFPRAAPGVNNPANWVDREKQWTTKCKLAKYELIAAILQMGETAKFQIVYFGGRVERYPQEGHLMPATLENKNKAIDRILAQRLSTGTKLIEGLELAFQQSEIDTIFLLSDGRPWNSRVMDGNQVVEIARQQCAGQRKIVINTVNMNDLPWRYPGRNWRKEPQTPICSGLAAVTGGQCRIFSGPGAAPFPATSKFYQPGGR